MSVLRGEESRADGDDPDGLDGNPLAAVNVHVARALAAAVFDDAAELDRHTAAAMPLLPFVESTYLTSTAHLLRALALASRARAVGPETRGAFLTELDAIIDWLAARAADAPFNFRHLLRLVEAERAWAVGDFRAAATTFDAALQECAGPATTLAPGVGLRTRGALLAGQRHRTRGLHHCSPIARRAYLAWGATAKVDQLDWAYPTLKTADRRRRRPGGGADHPPIQHQDRRPSTCSASSSASQAISSETSVDGLRARVVEVLSAMTGASGVHLLLRNDDRGWLLSTPSADGGAISLDEAGRRRLVPLSVIRYAERTREPLAVGDATRDDRFARDPYFVDLDSCALLAVPILTRGALQGLLLMENRLIRSAFSIDRLDGVMLIAGQLAVSLDNALVYASLERKVGERTRQLALANRAARTTQHHRPADWTGQPTPAGGSLSRGVVAGQDDLEHRSAWPWWTSITLSCTTTTMDTAPVTVACKGSPTDSAGASGTRTSRLVTVVRSLPSSCPNTDVDAALQVAERLRLAVATLAEPHPLTPDGIVTISVGVAATKPTSDGSVETLLEQADVELYRAKRGGPQPRAGSSVTDPVC